MAVAVAATVAVTIAAAPPYNKSLLATCFPAQLAQTYLPQPLPPQLPLLSPLASLQQLQSGQVDSVKGIKIERWLNLLCWPSKLQINQPRPAQST